MSSVPSDIKEKLMKLKGVKNLQKEYNRQMKMSGSGMKMKGGDFWSDLFNSIKKKAIDVNDWLKKNKVISTTGTIASAILPFTPFAELEPEVIAGTAAAKTAGYGKMKKTIKGGGLTAKPLTAGTTAKKPAKVYSGKETNQPILSQNGQFQNAIMVGGAKSMMKGGEDMSLLPTVYNTVSSTKKMKLQM